MPSAESIAFGICTTVILLYVGNWSIRIVSLVFGKCCLHRPKSLLPDDLVVGVSIIKPLLGTDPHLYDNLETFFLMEFPLFEVLFCVEDEHDEAILVVQKLMAKYPNIDAKVFIGTRHVGANAKVNNMIKAYDAAKYPLFMISDSGIRVKENTLSDMVATLGPKVGLVHQMPFVCDRQGFAAVYEKVYFGAHFACYYLFASAVGINVMTGMSCLIRKELVDQVGGLASFSNYLSEDYFLADTITKKGFKMVISSQPALQNQGYISVAEFNKRCIRWACLRVAINPLLSIMEPISTCFLAGLLFTLAVMYAIQCCVEYALIIFVCHVLAWMAIDYLLVIIVQNGPLPYSTKDFILAWCLHEFSSFFLLIRAYLSTTVVWRNKKYRLKWGGITEEVK